MKTTIPKVSTGKVIRFKDFKSSEFENRTLDVWVPNNYSGREKYAVIYMQDGQMLFDKTQTWNGQEWGVANTIGKLINEGKTMPCIVVGIWNNPETRHPDFFPQKAFDQLPNDEKNALVQRHDDFDKNKLLSIPIRSDAYLRFIVNDVKPFIDRYFSVYTDRQHTFIAGSSMGGLISLYGICEYPHVFGGAACLSTHWTGTYSVNDNPIPVAFLEYLKSHLPTCKTHRMYFDYGTETLDALYEKYQLRVDIMLRDMGYSEQCWITRKFEGADHSENAWKERLHIPISFLLAK